MYRLEVESYRWSRDKPDHLSTREEAYPSHHLYGLAEILGHQKSDALYPCFLGGLKVFQIALGSEIREW